MTGRIEAAVSWVRTVTAAVIAALASILMDAIKNSVKSQLVAVLLMVLGAVVLFSLIELCANRVLAASPALRRLILGPHFMRDGGLIQLFLTHMAKWILSGFCRLYTKAPDTRFLETILTWKVMSKARSVVMHHCTTISCFGTPMMVLMCGSLVREWTAMANITFPAIQGVPCHLQGFSAILTTTLL